MRYLSQIVSDLRPPTRRGRRHRDTDRPGITQVEPGDIFANIGHDHALRFRGRIQVGDTDHVLAERSRRERLKHLVWGGEVEGSRSRGHETPYGAGILADSQQQDRLLAVSYTHLRAHETR